MISIHVSAVLEVKDGFTQKPLGRSALKFTLDGVAAKPLYREGGYFVFTDLTAGKREILLGGPYFQDQRVEICARDDGREELPVSMKPAENYPFGGKVTRVVGRLAAKEGGAGGQRVWAAAKGPQLEVKIAQDACAAGDRVLRLYTMAKSGPPPGEYLLADGKGSELCLLLGMEDELGRFALPFAHGHKRGTCLYPASTYVTDEKGVFFVCFKEPGPVELFFPDNKKSVSAVLLEGENTVTVDWD